MNKLVVATAVAILASWAPASGLACCSVWPAHFSATKGYAGEAMKDGKLVHLLGYQNSLVNRTSGGNAMLLPIPAVSGTMTDQNILDTSGCSHFLDNMEQALTPPSRDMFESRSAAVQVFEHDIYTIVLAKGAKYIPDALSQVPENKRPALNPEIFSQYDKWYPGWTFALCCFDTAQQANAKPMLWWYEPLNPRELFFPAVDAHDGHVPNLKAIVDVDHTICVSTLAIQTNRRAMTVSYGDSVPAKIAVLLPKRVVGRHFLGKMTNGDFVVPVPVGDISDGIVEFQRKSPPGAGAVRKPVPGKRSGVQP